MTDMPPTQPPGWYYAQGDPPGTQRYWDGTQWQGAPQPVPTAGMAGQVQGGPQYASAGQRIGARFIDGLIYFVISAVIGAVLGGGTFAVGANLDAAFIVGSLVTALLVAAIEIYLVANGGQSIGKKALSIKIVKEDGSDMDMEVSVLRYGPYAAAGFLTFIPILGIIISLAILVVGLVSFIYLFTKDDLRTLWDNWAGTIVIKA